MSREILSFDIVIVGAGPSGLAASIRLKQLQPELRVCIVEKGSEVGAHILSGAVLEPRALNELIPDWQALGAPIHTSATSDQFLFLTQNHSIRLPTPSAMKNRGNYIISLGLLCRWLATQAEVLGVEIYPGFSATEVLYNENGHVIGIATGDMGLDKNGAHTSRYVQGIALHAKQTLFAEGCRGSLTKKLMDRFQLGENSNPQTYGIGVKELWEVSPTQHRLGAVIHTIGWPLDTQTYGGSFLYHLENNQVEVGFVIGLDYTNPYLNPFEEFQRFKTHPKIRSVFAGGRRISYGSRAISEGGFQSIPKLSFPGGLLIGDTAGFLNVPKIKGIHTAMKSGMVAAESIVSDLDYQDQLQKSWLWDELYRVRNIRPGFKNGLWSGLANAALDTYVLRGQAPWTLKNHADYRTLKAAVDCKKIIYPKPDGKITFDRLSSVFLSNIHHDENQPCHLHLKNPALAIDLNLAVYDSPEQRYCPAGVYEIIKTDQIARLQINAQNCIHCKVCDIKDPAQNIDWVPPEGGSGPNYPNM
jgi:electron-transferring-flavoprotein dehydrogenase